MTKTEIPAAVAVTEPQPGIALVTMDTPGSSANVLTKDLFAELDATFAKLQERTDLAGVILYSAKPKIFVAGADLKRIWRTLNWPDEKIIQFCKDGQNVMARLSQMSCPTVAAIHGACLGGGLEIALWCDYRIATTDRRTILGLPEVKLGLIPGWAGTVRLPRLAGLKPSLEMVTTGQPVGAEAAKEMGFVDQLSTPDSLIDDALAFIRSKSESDEFTQRRERMQGSAETSDTEKLIADYTRAIEANSEIFPFAPNVVLEHMTSSASKPHEEACHSESLAFANVYGSGPSYGLLNCFFLSDHNKKNPGLVDTSLDTKKIASVGIVGAGLMGSSIAGICANRGMSLKLLDASADAISEAMKTLDSAAVTPANEYSELHDCDLIIETVVETLEVKRKVLAQIEEHVSENTIIVSNTSAIPITTLGKSMEFPGRFCGVHFCHPQLMALVEVIAGQNTNPQTMAAAVGWARQLRKMPVAVADGPGFVVNRLLAAMLDQAVRLYGWGYSIEEIDSAVREFGFKGGPFEIVDIVGVETCMYAGRSMLEGKVNCVSMSPVLPRMVKQGWLGRKSGQGFYKYADLAADREFDPAIDELLKAYVDPKDRPQLDQNQIAESIMSAIVLEAAYLLDDEMVNDPRDIDLCIVHGFSFPQHQGGILFWADRFGVENVNSQLEMLARFEQKLQPTKRLKKMATNGETFYE